MSRGVRIAIVAGIIIAIAAGATIVAVFAPQSTTQPPVDNGNNTSTQPRQLVVNLNENLTVQAK
ncbi:MAG TPA: hypothetical protein VGQ13_06225 [Nitrososphaera sp.]|nr:hypothetical protein [Nitrososphaera sp.]